MSVDDRFRSGQVKPFLHVHRLPVQREKVGESRGDMPRGDVLLVPLNLADHGDRRFLSLLFGQVVPEERAVPLAFPADVQIEG
ncbi:MAG TPA: hypothetical protein PKD12_17920 [Nitrospira sp.]|nr:hypothetical protein [Nitrospira sp.]